MQGIITITGHIGRRETMDTKPQIARLLIEADEAIDSRTNGLMDREDFLVLIQQLSGVIRDLLVEREIIHPTSIDLPANFDSAPADPLQKSSIPTGA
jgi:hypothetical protein